MCIHTYIETGYNVYYTSNSHPSNTQPTAHDHHKCFPHSLAITTYIAMAYSPYSLLVGNPLPPPPLPLLPPSLPHDVDLLARDVGN